MPIAGAARATQRYRPSTAGDEEQLKADIITSPARMADTGTAVFRPFCSGKDGW